VEDIVCSGCSLLCDDVTAEVNKGEVRSLGLCLLGFTQLDVALKQKISQPTDDLIEQAAELLVSSENPLVYGGSYLSNEAIEVSLALVEILGGHFDSGASLGVLQAMTHSIHSSKLDVDLEYVRNNGEFIIYWGSDPAESVHRHPSRFAVLPRGDKIPEGVESRTIGVVDVRETETMKMANHRMIIPIGSDVEFLEAVTAELEGKSSITTSVLGIPAAEVIGFVNGFNKADCAVIFYGSGILNSGKTEEKLSALSRLIEAIRAFGKEAYALPMYPETNQMGVVKSTSTLSSSLQKIIADEFTTTLVIGEDPLANLPRSAAHALEKTKIVYIGPPGGLTDRMATVSIHTTDMIIQGSESMTRIDQVEIEFRPWKGSHDTNTMSEVLTNLHKLVKKKT
jgi:formylmethanofuran dehydrogenase subunit B